MELLTVLNVRPAKGARKKKKRVGRGIGSGHGKTSTRGQKGQHARNTVRPGFEGGQTPLSRRLPKLRGKSKGAMPLGPTRKFYGIANVALLNKLPAGTVVTAALLRKNGMVKGRFDGLRILGIGEISVALTVQANHFTASAKEKIEAAGGTAELLGATVEATEAVSSASSAPVVAEEAPVAPVAAEETPSDLITPGDTSGGDVESGEIPTA